MVATEYCPCTAVLFLCSLGELDKHVPNLIGGRTKLFVTPCVMHELRGLGADFRDTVAFARKIQLHYCGHGRNGTQPHAHGHAHAQHPGPHQQHTGEEGEEQQGGQQGTKAAAACILDQVGEWVSSLFSLLLFPPLFSDGVGWSREPRQ